MDDEFDVDEAARALFEVEGVRRQWRSVVVHFLPHGEDVFAQGCFGRAGEQFVAQAGVAFAEGRAPRYGAAAGECLVFPGPGVFALVAGESLDADGGQAACPAGAQAGVDGVDGAVAAGGAEQVAGALGEAGVVALVVDGFFAVGHAVRVAVVVEVDDVEV